ncbi:MAG: SRPBCC domain-containing protein [Myxococcales bacterium]|nr:SRPBCC domain-containing protein [Myxococcales bacterium]
MSTDREVLLFLNLPSADLGRTRAFFGELGFAFDDRFSNDQAQCMVLSDKAYVMWLSLAFFDSFDGHPRPDPRTTTGAFHCISQPSRAAVDAIVDRAIGLGARPTGRAQDHGFMYGRSFFDLDGHCWEVMWMDVDAATCGDGDPPELMVAASGDDAIRILRPIAAPVDRVFAAFTEPALIRRWCGVFNGVTMPECAFEARAGGAYRFVWEMADGATMAVGGEVLEIDAPTRLVTSERWDEPWYPGEGRVELTMRADGARTIVVQEIIYGTPEARDEILKSGMTDGMAQSFDALEKLLNS